MYKNTSERNLLMDPSLAVTKKRRRRNVKNGDCGDDACDVNEGHEIQTAIKT